MFNIVSVSAKKCQIFDGWKEVPSDYKTRGAWKRAFRKVKKGEKPTAEVITTIMRCLTSTEEKAEYTVEKPYKLYHVSQTQPLRQTPLNVAQQRFYDIFAFYANRQRLIRWTQGQWQDEDDQRYWDSTAEAWGWRTYPQHLGLEDCIAHVNGKEIYGAFGGETCSYLLIDLDLHKQPLDLFLRRLRALLDAFHGRYHCHFQVSDENAGGVHVILYFGKQGLLANRRKWITNELAKLDQLHPGINFTEIKDGKRSLQVEVYPGRSNAHRLPLCRGRTMLLNRPLSSITRGARQVQDVVGYVNWLKNPDWQAMEKDDVYRFVVERLDLSVAENGNNPSDNTPGPQGPIVLCSTFLEKDGGSPNPVNNTPGPQGPIVLCSTFSEEEKRPSKSLKGRTRQAIIGFWKRGEAGHLSNLNAAIAVTLRALYFEGLPESEAVELVCRYVDELPNDKLSARLPNNRPDIYRVIRRDASRIWDGNGGQADVEKSSRKWQKVISHWSQLGFSVSDKASWEPQLQPRTIVDCQDFEFTEDEKRLLVEEMAPVLVGRKQAKKPHKKQEVIQAVKFFLRYVKCHPGEIPRDALPSILKNFELKFGMDRKRQMFLKLLCDWEWIYIRADYYHPAKHGGKGNRGRARAYGIGEAMAGKFQGAVSYTTPHNPKGPIVLCSIFSESRFAEVEIPCFEEQLQGIATIRDADFGLETIQDTS